MLHMSAAGSGLVLPPGGMLPGGLHQRMGATLAPC